MAGRRQFRRELKLEGVRLVEGAAAVSAHVGHFDAVHSDPNVRMVPRDVVCAEVLERADDSTNFKEVFSVEV